MFILRTETETSMHVRRFFNVNENLITVEIITSIEYICQKEKKLD